MNNSIEQIKEVMKQRLCNHTLDRSYIDSLREHVKFMGFVEGDRRLIETLIDDYVRLSDELDAQVNYLDEIGEFDPILQIGNRNSIIRVIAREWEGSKRYHTPTSLIVLSVDGLSTDEIADESTATHLYLELAKLIDNSTRLTDTFGRLGGNKFALVVPTTNNIQAAWLSDKLRETIEEHEFDNGAKITCSFGVADSSDSMNAEDWLQIAEEAYREAVAKGGNSVVDYVGISTSERI